MFPEPELIADYACVCGEGPTWNPVDQRLYWTDIDTGRLFRYDPRTGAHEQIYTGDMVGGMTVQEDGSLLLFMDHGAIRRWSEGEMATVIEEIPEERDSRFNDVIADPQGRVFCGTMPAGERLGRLHRLDPDGTLRPVLDNIGCSNGMGFTPDRRRMYYTDSAKREIYLFDYEAATGSLSNQRLFVSLPEGGGAPDGMTVDADGCVWTALWGGWCIVRFSPDGDELARIRIPTEQTSCVAFGGSEYDQMYVTTAGRGKRGPDDPSAGALFRLDFSHTDIRGVPEYFSRVAVPSS